MYDREAVQFFDIAHEGAFVRAASALLDDGQVAQLRELQPRSLIVIAADDISRAAAELAVAVLAPLPVPITIVGKLPRFAGPLDAVLLASSKSAPAQERCLHEASRRACPTYLIAPPQGPLREEAPSDTYVIPVPPNAAGGSPACVIAAMVALVGGLTAPDQAVREQLELVAQAVDEELLVVTPERDALVNESRKIREFAGEDRVVHTGYGEIPTALARLIATWWVSKGLVCGALEATELGAALPDFNENASDIFYDPFEDDVAPVLPLRIVVWAAQDTHLPRAIAQSSGGDDLALDNVLRLMVRGLAATVM